MKLITYSYASDFLQRTQAALEQEEVVNNLLLGVALRLKVTPDAYGSSPYLATVENEGGLTLAALMTPPHPLTLFAPDSESNTVEPSFVLMMDDLRKSNWQVRFVSGRAPLVERCARAWAEEFGGTYHVLSHQRIYELQRVLPARSTPGRFRVATVDDADTIAQWSRAFMLEALPHQDPTGVQESARKRISQGDLFVWDVDGLAVSMAIKTRPLVNSITVSLVYTPPEKRNRGYAGALVAALSQHLLDLGWKRCTLFTDLANLTSNSIYQKIGYQPVCDFDQYELISGDDLDGSNSTAPSPVTN